MGALWASQKPQLPGSIFTFYFCLSCVTMGIENVFEMLRDGNSFAGRQTATQIGRPASSMTSFTSNSGMDKMRWNLLLESLEQVANEMVRGTVGRGTTPDSVGNKIKD